MGTVCLGLCHCAGVDMGLPANSVILLLLVLVYTTQTYGCSCTGDGNGSHPPCSTDYGEGLDGNPEHRRWCYVYPGQCKGERDSVTRPGAVWSHAACYEEYKPPGYDEEQRKALEICPVLSQVIAVSELLPYHQEDV